MDVKVIAMLFFPTLMLTILGIWLGSWFIHFTAKRLQKKTRLAENKSSAKINHYKRIVSEGQKMNKSLDKKRRYHNG